MSGILYTLPMALTVAYLTKGFAVPGIVKQQGKYDNNNPREQQAKLEGLPRRAIAAHYNGMEGFPAFAAGVLACVARGVTSPWATYLAFGYVAARVVYVACYVADIATLRSLVWGVGLSASVGLMLLAAS